MWWAASDRSVAVASRGMVTCVRREAKSCKRAKGTRPSQHHAPSRGAPVGGGGACKQITPQVFSSREVRGGAVLAGFADGLEWAQSAIVGAVEQAADAVLPLPLQPQN